MLHFDTTTLCSHKINRMLNVFDTERITFSWIVSEVFLLLRLFDYDRSGLLDGLEMMKLLSDYNSHHAPGAQASEQVRISGCVSPLTFQFFCLCLPLTFACIWLVCLIDTLPVFSVCVCVLGGKKVVSMVDFLLQTQDLNQDGLLAPSELLSPPLPQSQVLCVTPQTHWINSDVVLSIGMTV